MKELTHKEISSRGGKANTRLGSMKKALKSIETRFKLEQISETAYLVARDRLTKQIEELNQSPE